MPARPERVWRAFVSDAELSEWFGARVAMEARPGGRATFSWPDGRQRVAVIEAFEPRRLLVLRWLPFERDHGLTRPSVPGIVRFVLEPATEGTRISVTEERLGATELVELVSPRRTIHPVETQGWSGPRASTEVGAR